MEFWFFIAVSVGVIIVPGPNVLVIVSTSLSHGVWHGFRSVTGTSLAMILQLVIAGVATTWLVDALVSGFFWLKWIGVGYLVYLGIGHIRQSFMDSGDTQEPSAVATFARGFWVSLTNPKTILFFSAFLPQFVDPAASYSAQIVLLSAIFWLLAVVLDSSYVILAGKIHPLLRTQRLSRYRNGITGSLFLGAGTVLALSKSDQ